MTPTEATSVSRDADADPVVVNADQPTASPQQPHRKTLPHGQLALRPALKPQAPQNFMKARAHRSRVRLLLSTIFLKSRARCTLHL